MKNLIIGLFVLGFTSLGYTQEQRHSNAVELADVIISPLNMSYLNKVQDEFTPVKVKHLEDKAARFDITESPVYDRKFEAYEVVFTDAYNKNQGNIVATYDSNGKILRSLERYKETLLPPKVRNAIFKRYPNCSLESNLYLLTYYHNKDVKKVYKVRIKDGDKKMNLHVDHNGNM